MRAKSLTWNMPAPSPPEPAITQQTAQALMEMENVKLRRANTALAEALEAVIFSAEYDKWNADLAGDDTVIDQAKRALKQAKGGA